MKKRQGSGIQFIQRDEEIRKCDLLRKTRAMREEIISLKECRTPLTQRDTQDHHRTKEVTMSPQRKHPMVMNNRRTEPTVVLPKRKKKK